MGECALCGKKGLVISSLGVCSTCLRSKRKSLDAVRSRRTKWRMRLGLPPIQPQEGSVKCSICVNACSIPEGGRGYCGVWVNRGGRLQPLQGRDKLIVHTYLDPHPTNCVAEPVCPAATGRGYPQYTFTHGVERGYYNLAVFLGGCPLDCVFCQNWEHKIIISSKNKVRQYIKSLEDLVSEALNPYVTCVCYFGGDPTPHLPLLLRVNKRIIEESEKRGQKPKRICWETNGLANPRLVEAAARQSLVSGGIYKIDWKAWTPSIYEALTGVNGEKAVERLKVNTRIVASMATKRREPPLLVISVLLVPGYVDEEEVRMISRYIARLMDEYGVDIPLVLLAFHPDNLAKDLPPTSTRHMLNARNVALEEGIKEVYMGNIWLLGDYY